MSIALLIVSLLAAFVALDHASHVESSFIRYGAGSGGTFWLATGTMFLALALSFVAGRLWV